MQTNKKKLAHREDFLAWIAKYQLPILLALALIPSLVSLIYRAYTENFGSSWGSLYYFVGYETGFGGRKLLGTLMGWILPSYSTYSHIRPLLLGINILMLAFFSIFIVRLSKTANHECILPVFLLYLICPFSLTQWVLSGLSFRFLETWHIVISLLFLFLFLKAPRKWYYYIATLLLAVTGCLIHHTFCCTYFPLFIALFLFELVSRGKFSARHAAPYLLICIALASLLGIIWLFSHMNMDREQLQAYLLSKASYDACCHEPMPLDFFYYMTNAENRAVAFAGTRALQFGIDAILSLIFLCPLITAFLYPWFSAANHTNQPLLRWGYRIIGLTPTAFSIPMFIMACDYSRWWVAWFFCSFCLLAAALASGDLHIRQALNRITNFTRRQPWILVVVLLASVQMNPYGIIGLDVAVKVRNLIFIHLLHMPVS